MKKTKNPYLQPDVAFPVFIHTAEKQHHIHYCVHYQIGDFPQMVSDIKTCEVSWTLPRLLWGILLF